MVTSTPVEDMLTSTGAEGTGVSGTSEIPGLSSSSSFVDVKGHRNLILNLKLNSLLIINS